MDGGIRATGGYTAQLECAQERLDEVNLELERMVQRNTRTAQDQEEYNRTFDALSAKCGALKEKIRTLKARLAAKAGRKRNIEAFIKSSVKQKAWSVLMSNYS